MQVVSINVTEPERVHIDGREWLTAMGKKPVGAPVEVRPLGLAGDGQADLAVHGGQDKAVYAYPLEHYPVWQTLRAQAGVAAWGAPLPFGAMGENLSLRGLVESSVSIGDVLCFEGGCELAVSAPRFPCEKFNLAMGFKHAARMMTQSRLCGFYLAVRRPGVLSPGESFQLRPGPREVGIIELFRARTSAARL
jgi:MOSC domain-containing protein YiiM